MGAVVRAASYPAPVLLPPLALLTPLQWVLGELLGLTVAALLVGLVAIVLRSATPQVVAAAVLCVIPLLEQAAQRTAAAAAVAITKMVGRATVPAKPEVTALL